MKNARNIFLHLSWLFGCWLLCSCVEEPNFPEEQDDTITQSVALTRFLDGIKTEDIVLSDDMVRVDYPIKLGYNNSITIDVLTNEGLKEVITSQSSGFHIEGVGFPITMVIDHQVSIIEGESDFNNVLDTELGIETVREGVENAILQCFDFNYPITLFDGQGEEVNISSATQFEDFISTQEANYQPLFEFPIAIEVFDETEELLVESYFDLNDAFGECATCPELFFTAEDLGESLYLFQADFQEIFTLGSYDWVIDDVVIETDGIDQQGDHLLIYAFEETGTYEVCMKAQTLDCTEGVEFCKTITVEPDCPEVSFVSEDNEQGNYIFFADFSSNEDIDYTWFVFEGELLLFSELEDDDGDDQLIFQFSSGIFDVCIQVESELCIGEPDFFCQTIIVE